MRASARRESSSDTSLPDASHDARPQPGAGSGLEGRGTARPAPPNPRVLGALGGGRRDDEAPVRHDGRRSARAHHRQGRHGGGHLQSVLSGRRDRRLLQRQVRQHVVRLRRILRAHGPSRRRGLERGPGPREIEQAFVDFPSSKALLVVHSDTSTGVLNDVAAMSALARSRGALSMVDSISGVGGSRSSLTIGASTWP